MDDKMNMYDKLEKLYTRFQQGSITAEEYDAKKQKLLNQNLIEIGPKYQVVYVVMALFFGSIGAHNYYIGRWKRGLTQTLITILSFGFGYFISYLWAIINIFAIKTDGKNRRLFPSKIAKIICGTLSILAYLIYLFVFVVGTIAGYTLAMNRHRAEEILDSARKVEATARMYHEDQTFSPMTYEYEGDFR